MKTILAIFAIIVQASYGADIVLYSTSASTNAPAALTSGLRVRYIDYDGTVLSTQFVATNGTATPPANPSHDLLTFTEWNLAGTNITQDTDIGATYSTTDGKTYVFLTVTTVTTLTNTLYLNNSTNNTLSVDWGDGVTSTFTNSGNFNTEAHGYPSNGNYVVKLWISAGVAGTYGLGNATSATSFSGGATQVNRDMLTACFVGTNITSIGAYAFYGHQALTAITIPTSVTSFGSFTVQTCYSLTSLTIPSSITSLPATFARNCTALAYVSLPSSITSIGEYAFNSCPVTCLTIPSGVTNIARYAFYSTGISSITIPSGVTSIIEALFSSAALSSITIPSGVTAIGNNAFAGASLRSLTIPSGVTNIGTTAFQNLIICKYYNFTPTNPPTIASNTVFSGILSSAKIYVPDAYFDTYTNAPQWSTEPVPRSYIYPVSQKP